MSPRRGLSIDTIVDAAVDIADQEGVEAVTMASLSERLGIRSPSLYNHISGLGGLRWHMSLRGLRMLGDELESVIAAAKATTRLAVNEERISSDGSEDELMLALAKRYIAFARSHQGLYELTLRAPEERGEPFEAASGRIIELLLAALKPYSLNDDTAVHMIRGFRSILHGFASLEREGGFGLPYSVDESVEQTVKAFLNGLKKRQQ